MYLRMGIFFVLGFLWLVPAQTYQKTSKAGATAIETRALQSLTALLLNSSQPIVVPIATDSRQMTYIVQLNTYQIPLFRSILQIHAREMQQYAQSIQQYLQSFQKKASTRLNPFFGSDSSRSPIQIVVHPTDSATHSVVSGGTPGADFPKRAPDSLLMKQRLQKIRMKLDSIAIKFLGQYADAGNRLPMEGDIVLVFYLFGAESWFQQWNFSPLWVYRVLKRDILRFRQARIPFTTFSHRIQREIHIEVPLKVDTQVFTEILPTALQQLTGSQSRPIQFSRVNTMYLKGDGMIFFISTRFTTSPPFISQRPSDTDREKRALQWLKNFVPGFIQIVQTYGTFLANLPDQDQLIFAFHPGIFTFNADMKYFIIRIPVQALQQLRGGRMSSDQFARQVKVDYSTL